jgi:hypothetical protein
VEKLKITKTEKKMDEVLGPIDAILLGSPNGKFQVRLCVGDDGHLYAELLVREENDKFEGQRGVAPARLAIVQHGQRGEIVGFTAG